MTTVKVRLFILLLMASVACLAITGCAPKNTVRLMYSSAENAALPVPGAPQVTVVIFEDKRTKAELGAKKSGELFVANTLVTDWVSRSLADEISRMGPQVSYAMNLPQALAANPDYIVTGNVQEVWVKDTGPTSYSTTIRVSFELKNRQGKIYGENLTATQERASLPSPTMVESLLSDTLREVLGVAASKINEHVNKPGTR